MTSQLIFGERVEKIRADEKGWLCIRCLHDGYEGWVREGQLQELSPAEEKKATRWFTTSHDSRLIFEYGCLHLPLGAELPNCAAGKLRVGEAQGTFKGKKALLAERTFSPQNLKEAALQFLHAPYLWGGRTVMGIDCSGLIQIAFKLCGFAMPRDAWQQAEKGTTVDFLQEASCGDVAFFSNDEGRIVHVGLLLDPASILHATETSGRAVIDRIDPEGIISVNLKRRTHKLRTIKRYEAVQPSNGR